MAHFLDRPVVAFLLAGLYASNACAPVCAKEHHDDEDEHHEHSIHDTSGIELGLAAGYVNLVDEDEDATSVHLHLIKRLGSEGLRQYFGVGLGTELILAEHEHYGAMASLSMYPWRDLVLTVSPGVIWVEEEGDWESEYATHIEAAYVFPVGQYHMGPVFGCSRTDDEEHYMIGLHIGVPLGGRN